MTAHARALVLDFGGVISRTVFETQEQNERALGLAPGSLYWRGPFGPENDSLWRDMQQGVISERVYWFRRARETGLLLGEEWDTLPKFLQRIRGTDPGAAIRPEALSAIARVKRSTRKLAILSNELDLFYGAAFRQKLPFLEAFDLIVDATYTGILKPDPRAYAFITVGLGLAAGECVFVDDQLKNIEGAEALGFQACHFDVLNPASSYAAALQMLGIDQEI